MGQIARKRCIRVIQRTSCAWINGQPHLASDIGGALVEPDCPSSDGMADTADRKRTGRTALGLLCGYLIATLLAWQLWIMVRTLRATRPSTLSMQAAQIAGLIACANLLPAGIESSFDVTPPGTLVAHKFAFTDKGTPVALYDREVTPELMSTFYDDTSKYFAQVARSAMRRDDAQPQVNCHGWVFSGTEIVKGEDVPLILRENDYVEVDAPQLNDLVIYSDPSGFVVHTGVVCGFLKDDSILVEGKWGVAGTYMHLVDEQPYSPSYKFYRSPRTGHRLQLCEPKRMRLVMISAASQPSQQ